MHHWFHNIWKFESKLWFKQRYTYILWIKINKKWAYRKKGKNLENYNSN